MKKVETALRELEKINDSIVEEEKDTYTIEKTFFFGDKLKTKEKINIIGDYITKGALQYIEPFYKPKEINIKKENLFFNADNDDKEKTSKKLNPLLLSITLLSSTIFLSLYNSPFSKFLSAFSEGTKNINKTIKDETATLNDTLKDTLNKIDKSNFNEFMVQLPYYFYYPFYVMEDMLFHVFDKKEEVIIGWKDLSYIFHVPKILYDIFTKSAELIERSYKKTKFQFYDATGNIHESYTYEKLDHVELEEGELDNFASNLLGDYVSKENINKSINPLKNQAEYARIAYNLSQNITEGEAKIWSYFRYRDAKEKEKSFEWAFDGKKWTHVIGRPILDNSLTTLFSARRLKMESKNKKNDALIRKYFGDRLEMLESLPLSSDYARELYKKGKNNLDDSHGTLKRDYDYYYNLLLTTAQALENGVSWDEIYASDSDFDKKISFFVDSSVIGLQKDLKEVAKDDFAYAKKVLLKALENIGNQLKRSGELSTKYIITESGTIEYKDPLMSQFAILEKMINEMEDDSKGGNKLLKIISNINRQVSTKDNKAWSLLQKLNIFSLKENEEMKEAPETFMIYERMLSLIERSKIDLNEKIPEMEPVDFDSVQINKITVTNKSKEIITQLKSTINESFSLKRKTMKNLNKKLKNHLENLK